MLKKCFSVVRRRNIGPSLRNLLPLASYSAMADQGDVLTASVWENVAAERKYVLCSSLNLGVRSSIIKGCRQYISKHKGHDAVYDYFLDKLKKCATAMIHEKPMVKVQLGEKLLKMMKKAGVKPDIAFYNQLLRVYCYNDHPFVPSEFIGSLKEDNCTPNIGTLILLMKASGYQGNLDGISIVHDMMKNHGVGISDVTYASMITGHSRSGDLKGAEQVLESMKTAGHSVSSVVYTSLLCAYAERGLLDEIKKTLDEMKTEKVPATIKTYIAVIDSLSKNGHSKLIEEILSLLGNWSWLIPGLRSACLVCLSREEMESAAILFTHAHTDGDFQALFATHYVPFAINSGMSFEEMSEKFKGKVNSTLMVQDLLENLCYYPSPTLDTSVSKRIPNKGSLAPHPLGKRWVQEMRSALRALHGKQKVRDILFFPLLARHCSDADVEDIVKTISLMVQLKSDIRDTVYRYIMETFSNAGITMDEFLSSQNVNKETDTQWLRDLLIFQCVHGKWSFATTTLKLIREKYTPQIFEYVGVAVRLGCRKHGDDCSEFVEELCCHKDGLTPLVKHLCYYNGRVNLQLLKSLKEKGVDLDQAVMEGVRMLERKEFDRPRDFLLWIIRPLYTPSRSNVVAALYQCLIENYPLSNFIMDLSSKYYAMLPEETKKMFRIRCFHVVQLASSMHNFRWAWKEFMVLLEEGSQIPAVTWKKIVLAAYGHDPKLGDNLFRRMEQNEVYPNGHMLFGLLLIHSRNDDKIRAEDVLQRIEEWVELSKSKYGNFNILGVNVNKAFNTVLYLYANTGDLESIEKFEKKGCVSKADIIEAKVLALINNNNSEEAQKMAMHLKHPSSRFLRKLLKRLVFKNYSLNEWKKMLLAKGVSEHLFESIMFFTYMDYDMEKAKLLYQTMKNIDQEELQWRRKSQNWRKYVKLLNQWNNKLRLIRYNTKSLKALGHNNDEDEVEVDISELGDIVDTDSDSVSKYEGFTLPEDCDEDRVDDMYMDNIDINERGENSGENLDMKKRKDDREMIDV